MKWHKKGHEFDSKAELLITKWNRSQSIYLFGAGAIGKNYKNLLSSFNVFKGYIDNNVNNSEDIVYSPNSFFSEKSNGWIILCASNENIKQMKKQLEREERCGENYYVYEHKDFFENIFPVIVTYALNKIYDNLCQICVTERCTLKCEKCAHGCWNIANDAEDMPIENVKLSADKYFKAFDYVQEFVLIGGEPFLYRDLAQAISYIGKKYRHKINRFAITTNGTIIPKDVVLNVCKEYGVHIHISNYGKTLPQLKQRYLELCNILESNDITYELSNADDMWMDYGFDQLIRNDNEDLVAVFDSCKTPCREVRENRYYYCVQARAVSDNMDFKVGSDDYFDLDTVINTGDKKSLLEFCMGYSEKGYLDMCKYCYGAEAVSHIIPRAIQRKK